MSDNTPKLPGEKPKITPTRVLLWVLVGGVGVFLLVSGIIGIIAKG
jgi:hypothetical protein